MSLAFSEPLALGLAVLAFIPARGAGAQSLAYSSLLMAPPDVFSLRLDWALRGLGAAIVLLLAAGLSGPYRGGQWVERIGTGAHVTILLDHSSSMNENFAGRYMGGAAVESKGAVAGRLLGDFVGRRKADLIGLVAFSAAPISALPLTQDRSAVQGAIRSFTGRGHGVTNIASGLAMALSYFQGERTGSRLILLVSDGAARMDEQTRDYLRQQFQDRQASLYWVYLRNARSGSLSAAPKDPNESTTPEFFLHQFFQTLGVPYRAYEVENPEAVQRAIADVEQLENHPLHYRERLPRQDLSAFCYGAALSCLLVWLGFKATELRTWHS